MNHDAKVVQIRQGDPASSLPRSLMRLRDSVARYLQGLLNAFFDGSDDALFNMTDKAANHGEQTIYFDAMRELRLARKPVTHAYLQWVSRSFNDLSKLEQLTASDDFVSFSVDTLALVEPDVFEEQIAVEGMIKKLHARCGDSLRLLQVRMEHLLPQWTLSEARLPLSPENLCRGMVEAFSDLELDIRARLVIFKLFDRTVLSQFEALYKEANDFLAGEGVLSGLRRAPAVMVRQASPATAVSEPESEAGWLSSSEPMVAAQLKSSPSGPLADSQHLSFDELVALMRPGTVQFARSIESTAGAGVMLATDNLVSLLAQVQGQLSVTRAGLSGAGRVGSLRLMDTVNGLIALTGEAPSLKQMDSDVINLVSMLFEFILEDRQLPDPMKALLGRLQIPILKVALLDRTFFNRGGHPARKLLNELATVALGWNPREEGQKDPLRERIEAVVNRIINEFSSDVSLFSALLTEFVQFSDLEQRRRELIEQRLRDAEEGRARNEEARRLAVAAIDALIAGQTLPVCVTGLLQDPWCKVLQWSILREGMDSELWQTHWQSARELVASVVPDLHDPEARDRLLLRIPDVMQGVRAGLQLIAWDPFGADSLLRDLELVHVDVLQQLTVLTPVPAVEQETVAVTPNIAVLMDIPQEASPVDSVLASPQEKVSVADESLASWMAAAGALRVGSWIEWMPDGERKLRCKLAAIIRASGKYIFVNRTGSKVAEFSLREVAIAMSHQQILVLNDGLIFDRALESIIDNLRGSQRD